MKDYYFNSSADDKGNHEVHTRDCSWLPNINNRVYIGYYSNCKDAISAAKNQHPSKSFDGCFWCCRNCNHG